MYYFLWIFLLAFKGNPFDFLVAFNAFQACS